jgi:hypothetical protein
MMEAVPATIPLLLPGGGRVRAAYGPMNDLATFVAILRSAGVEAHRIDRDVRSLAALEVYVGNVDGEGHEGLHGNHEKQTVDLVREAMVGCDVLGLNDLRSIASDFLTTLAVDADGRSAFERGDGPAVRPLLADLDERMYGQVITDVEAAVVPDRVPGRYREDVARVLEETGMYGRRPPAVRGLVWILNRPDLMWHGGPGYRDAVLALVRASE